MATYVLFDRLSLLQDPGGGAGDPSSGYRGVSNLRSHTFEQSVCVTLNLTSAEKQSVCVTLNLTSAEKQSVCDVKWAVIGFARNGCVRTSISVQSVHDY